MVTYLQKLENSVNCVKNYIADIVFEMKAEREKGICCLKRLRVAIVLLGWNWWAFEISPTVKIDDWNRCRSSEVGGAKVLITWRMSYVEFLSTFCYLPGITDRKNDNFGNNTPRRENCCMTRGWKKLGQNLLRNLKLKKWDISKLTEFFALPRYRRNEDKQIFFYGMFLIRHGAIDWSGNSKIEAHRFP